MKPSVRSIIGEGAYICPQWIIHPNMSRRTMPGRSLIVLAGSATVLTGAALTLASRRVTVEELGTFEWYLVALVGAIIIVLGLTMVLAGRGMTVQDKWARSLFATIVSSVVLAFMGAVMLLYSSPLYLEGIGGTRGFWLGLLGTWLLALAMVGGLIAMAIRGLGDRLGKLGPIAFACYGIVIAEGAAVMGFSAPFTVGSISFSSSTMLLAGAQLALLGACLAVLPFIIVSKPARSRYDVVSMILVTAIGCEGLVVVVLASTTVLGPYVLGIPLVMLLGAQLTMLATIAIFCMAFSPMARARLQGTAFLISVVLLLAMPILAVLTHL